MAMVVSTYFCMIIFPHKGSITAIDQLSLFTSSSHATGSIPFFHGPPPSLQNIGVGLFKDPSLMGTFSLPSPATLMEIDNIETCNMINSTSSDLRKMPNDSKVVKLGNIMLLSQIELV